MCCASSDDYFTEPAEPPSFESVQNLVQSEFEVTESYLEHNIPTFIVKHDENSKEAFLTLMDSLDRLQLLPLLRQKNEKNILRIVSKPPTQPTRDIINIALLGITLVTLFISGYFMSEEILGGLMFTGAIMLILGTHEMGHKLLANKHAVEATYPYFIPGLPYPYGIGTFGALIRQKALPPNKDALFDIGFTGPITGFIISVIVTIIGLQISVIAPLDPTADTASYLPIPLMFQIILLFVHPSGTGNIIMLHPVAFAGWVGMVVTMLNLVPSGMFDGGHVARSILSSRAHKFFSYLGVALLAIAGWWPMAVLALFFSSANHPGPLDDVSKLTTSRKIGAIILAVIFVLSIVPIGLSF